MSSNTSSLTSTYKLSTIYRLRFNTDSKIPLTMPTHPDLISKDLLPSTSENATLDASSTVRRLKSGIFEIAYETLPRGRQGLRLAFSLRLMHDLYMPARHALRIFSDLRTFAPADFTVYILGMFWSSCAPAFSLYLASLVIEIVRELYLI